MSEACVPRQIREEIAMLRGTLLGLSQGNSEQR
jgi:hypothetical protein